MRSFRETFCFVAARRQFTSSFRFCAIVLTRSSFVYSDLASRQLSQRVPFQFFLLALLLLTHL